MVRCRRRNARSGTTEEDRIGTAWRHVYPGRYKSFPVETDEYFYHVVRYVERNSLRAKLVKRAEDGRWSALWRREHGDSSQRSILSPWPLRVPHDWPTLVNQPQSQVELEGLRRRFNRSQPYGSTAWAHQTAKALGLQSTLRSRGRPKKDHS